MADGTAMHVARSPRPKRASDVAEERRRQIGMLEERFEPAQREIAGRDRQGVFRGEGHQDDDQQG